jgi:tetratricopeptide (TPR) repeat protein
MLTAPGTFQWCSIVRTYKDLEEGGFDSVGKRGQCAPNSKMFHRLAKYYAHKKETNLAMIALEDARKLFYEDEQNFDIMETEAKLHLDMGNYLKAFKCAEIILHPPGYKDSITAIYVKGQALFSLCDFEHALIMFYKGKKINPNSHIFIDGVGNCEESINKILNRKNCFDNINFCCCW